MENRIKKRIKLTKNSLKNDLLTNGERWYLKDELEFLNDLLVYAQCCKPLTENNELPALSDEFILEYKKYLTERRSDG